MKTRDEILSGGPGDPWPTIDIPEWGGEFKLRPLSGALAEEIQLLVEQAVSTGKYDCLKGLRARVAVACVCDQDGETVFKPADAAALTDKHLPVLQRIFERVKATLSFTKEEQDAIAGN